jgi:predicted cupin superfamily sugar epimerase
METAEDLLRAHALLPHPEGGFYRETYRSPAVIPGGVLPGFPEPRAAATAILFLLPAGAVSRLHRIRSDELWHFHAGGPLRIVSIAPDGSVESVVLGPDGAAGQRLQYAVPAGRWFGAFPEPGTAHALVGCTVSPGFDFKDFELGRRAELLKSFPGARAEIERLTVPD